MNHGDGGKPTRGGRRLTPDEAALWRQLTHSVDKAKAKPRVAAHEGPVTLPAEASLPAVERPAARSRTVISPSAMPAAPSPAPPKPPRPGEFERRTLRQVAGGKVPIDATLDLHGLHKDTAHARLRAFLVKCQAKGHRIVLVITGKGGGGRRDSERHSDQAHGGDWVGASARGVLRRSVPLWLEEPEFRAIVVSYAAAGVRHGGEGALYIRLRKAREG